MIDEWRLQGKPRVTLMDKNGEVLLETMYNPFKMNNQSSMPEVSEALLKGWGTSLRWCPYVEMKMFFVAGYFEYVDIPPMIIRLVIPYFQIKRAMNSSTSMIILGGVVIFITFSLFSLIITREITNPIMRIASIIKEFSNGNSGVGLPHFSNAELNLISTELNRMMENLTRRDDELSVLRDQTAKILSSMHDGIIVMERNGIIKQANNAAGEIFGYGEKDLQGKSIYAVLRSEELHKSTRSAGNGHDATKGQIRIFVPDERYIDFSCSPYGNGAGVLILLHDTTRIAHLERIRSEFVTNVSHELKTPITSLKGFVETLRGMQGAGDKMQKKFLDIINRNIQRMENIVEDLMMLSRTETDTEILSDRPVNVNMCIINAIGLIEARYGKRKVHFTGNEFSFYIKGEQTCSSLCS